MSFRRCAPGIPGLPQSVAATRLLRQSIFSSHHPKRGIFLIISLILIVSLAYCGNEAQAIKNSPQIEDANGMYNDSYVEHGLASWYGDDFHGETTSNGETYDMHEMTAAHKTLPMDTMLRVKNLDTGKDVVVRINDRGPFVRGRIIDLSYKAAKTLEIVKNGTARVQVVALDESHLMKSGETSKQTNRALTIGEYYVQIGSFSQQGNALKLQKRFTETGHTTVIQKSPASILYRVLVYAGRTLQDAKVSEKALHGRGYAGSFIISR